MPTTNEKNMAFISWLQWSIRESKKCIKNPERLEEIFTKQNEVITRFSRRLKLEPKATTPPATDPEKTK